MNTKTIWIAGCLVLAIASSGAASGASSAYEGSLLTWDSGKAFEPVYNGSLKFLSLNAYVASQTRDMDYGSGATREWDQTRAGAYLGFDLTRWLTLHVGGGGNSVKVDSGTSDSGGEWLVGGQLRLLDYWILEPLVGDEPYWLSVDVNGRYAAAKVGADFGDVTWNEMSGSLLFTLYTRPERWGFIDRIGLFAGPAYSVIDGSDDSDHDISADQAMGFIGGLTFNPNYNVTLKVQAQSFGKAGIAASLGFHF
jgi:opacity protein-like surface antigen